MIRAKVMTGTLTLEISGDKWPLFVSCLKKMKVVPSEANPDAIRVFNEVMEEINGVLRSADEAAAGLPTVEEICSIRGVDEQRAEKIRHLMSGRIDARGGVAQSNRVMEEINELIVEDSRSGIHDIELRGGEHISYCHHGGLHATTVFYDHDAGEFMVSSVDELRDSVDATERDRQEILRDD